MTDSVEALLKEISQLKRRLLYYEQHHRSCGFERPPSPPLEEERGDFHAPQAWYESIAPTAATNLHNTRTAAKGLEIVYFDPLSTKDISTKDISTKDISTKDISTKDISTKDISTKDISTKDIEAKSERTLVPRHEQWRTVANQFIGKVPHINEWTARRRILGLESDQSIIAVICRVSGALNGSSKSIFDNHDGEVGAALGFCNDRLRDTSVNLIAIAHDYALITRSSQVNADFACLLNRFQELIFASLCAVLERHGADVALINDAMRICISNSEPPNLKRLRDGAVWANRMIMKLAETKGWNLFRATEMIFLSGNSISQYGILSRSTGSVSYVNHQLAAAEYTKSCSGTLEGAPFSIPAFVKALCRGRLTLQQICQALDYQESSLDQLDHLYSWYKGIFDHPQPTSLAGYTFATNKKRKLRHTQEILQCPSLESLDGRINSANQEDYTRNEDLPDGHGDHDEGSRGPRGIAKEATTPDTSRSAERQEHTVAVSSTIVIPRRGCTEETSRVPQNAPEHENMSNNDLPYSWEETDKRWEQTLPDPFLYIDPFLDNDPFTSCVPLSPLFPGISELI